MSDDTMIRPGEGAPQLSDAMLAAAAAAQPAPAAPQPLAGAQIAQPVLQAPELQPQVPMQVPMQAAAPAMDPAQQAQAALQAMVQQPAEQPLHPSAEQPHIQPAPMAAPAQPAMVSDMHAPAHDEELENVRPVPRISVQAFCQSEGVAAVINAAARDRRMTKAHVKTQMGSVALAAELYQTTSTPNLIVLESQDDPQVLLSQLDALAEHCDEGTNVVVIGHRNDVWLYRQLVARGVSEYLVAPVTMGEFMKVVSDLFVASDAAPLGNTIAFIGAKGGVGSSTVAHNVAFTIAHEFQSDVILTDLDLAWGTANIDFDKDPAQGVAEAVFSSDRIDDTFLDRLLAKCSDHLSLLAAPSTLDRTYDFSEADFSELIETAQRGTPNVVIDMPHVWTGWAKEVLTTADKVVITATPDLASLRNTKNLVDQLAELRPNDEAPCLVLNQVGVPKRPEISESDFSNSLGLDVTATIGFEPALFGLASNNGQMIAETEAKSEAAAKLLLLSQIVTGRRPLVAEKKSSFSFLDKLRKKA